jgi:hypothetical protein
MLIRFLFIIACLLLFNGCYEAEIPQQSSCKVTRIDNLREGKNSNTKSFEFRYDTAGRISQCIFFESTPDSNRLRQTYRTILVYDKTTGKLARVDYYDDTKSKSEDYFVPETNPQGQLISSSYFYVGDASSNFITKYIYQNGLLTQILTPSFIDFNPSTGVFKDKIDRYVYDNSGNVTEVYNTIPGQKERLVAKHTAYDNQQNQLQLQNSPLLISFLLGGFGGGTIAGSSSTPRYLSRNNVLKRVVYDPVGEKPEKEFTYLYRYNTQGFPFTVKVSELDLSSPDEIGSASDYSIQYQCP